MKLLSAPLAAAAATAAALLGQGARAASTSAGSSATGTAATSAATATNHIVVKGNAFFDNVTNERFYIRGVDYQPGGSSSLKDPLASNSSCKRDIPYMAKLGINVIRVYQIDNSEDHSECMQALADAGIYLVLDVNTSQNSLTREATADSYNAIYLQHVFATIDAFKGYDNTLGFFAGNEVVNDPDTSMAGTYVKAVVRDMKNYIKAQSSRTIPVGYSAADVSANRVLLAEYLNCGDDETSRADFYAFNQYEWCGNSSYTESGYDQRVKEFSNYSLPLFFSEFGCNDVDDAPGGGPNRPFTEIEAIYSDKMTPVFSGGLVYEYTQEDNNYGLVEVDGDTVTVLEDYNTLKEMYAKTPNPTGDGGYKSSGEASTCPQNTSDFTIVWQLPDMPEGAEKYIKDGAGKPLGNDGPSNFNEGADATLSQSAGTYEQTATLSQSGNGGSQTATATGTSSAASTSSQTKTASATSGTSSSTSTSDSAGAALRPSSAGPISFTALVGVAAALAIFAGAGLVM